MIAEAFSNLYRDKAVLVTGHTGFKGSWLSAWLLELGARVTGVANEVPTEPAHFSCAGLGERITDLRLDIRDRQALREAVDQVQPDFVFHLAAQSLVRRSYREPIETLAVNLMGSAHLLDALRRLNKPCTVVMITSDKCYDNVEWAWGYRETDRLGGKDPYSASKAAAELAIRTFVSSYFSAVDCPIRVAAARAGNVIGGGDWAEDRLVPDCIRAWAEKRPVEIRSPQATRPWQHVLEPLSGYLALAGNLAVRRALNGEPFNFGPPSEQSPSVLALIEAMQQHWPGAAHVINANAQPDDRTEAGLLKLNCDKALAVLQWRTTLDFAETVRLTVDWYRRFYQCSGEPMLDVTLGQIRDYVATARQRDLAWTR